MKQHITVEELNKLSEKASGKLRDWYFPRKTYGDLILYPDPITSTYKGEVLVFGEHPMQGDSLPLFSIGQMVEFLDEPRKDKFDKLIITHGISGWWVEGYNKDELADALWEAVKEVLET
jgi:hypothetical protein